MKIKSAALAMLTLLGATSAAAQPARSGGTIPPQFHGRWAENQRACRTEHFTTVITINATGWSSFEEGGRVTRVGQVRRGTHYFRLANYAGANETSGSMAMRREGARLILTFDDDNDRPNNHTLIRCR